MRTKALRTKLEEVTTTAELLEEARRILSCDGIPCRALLSDLSARLEASDRAARDFAESLDNIREALGPEETHYLIIADEVRELRAKLDSALSALRTIRDTPNSKAHALVAVNALEKIDASR